MYSFLCINCGGISYSSSSYDFLESDICPICNKRVKFISEDTKLGEVLMILEYLEKYDLDRALAIQTRHGNKLGEVLLLLNLINQGQLNYALNFQMKVRNL